MTHAGTRLFWFSSFARRFFFAFDFLPIVAITTQRPHKILFFRASETTPARATGVGVHRSVTNSSLCLPVRRWFYIAIRNISTQTRLQRLRDGVVPVTRRYGDPTAIDVPTRTRNASATTGPPGGAGALEHGPTVDCRPHPRRQGARPHDKSHIAIQKEEVGS